MFVLSLDIIRFNEKKDGMKKQRNYGKCYKPLMLKMKSVYSKRGIDELNKIKKIWKRL